MDTTSPAGRLLFTMLGAIAEFERDLIIKSNYLPPLTQRTLAAVRFP